MKWKLSKVPSKSSRPRGNHRPDLTYLRDLRSLAQPPLPFARLPRRPASRRKTSSPLFPSLPVSFPEPSRSPQGSAMEPRRRERQVIVVAGAAALVAVGLNIAFSAVAAHRRRKRQGEHPQNPRLPPFAFELKAHLMLWNWATACTALLQSRTNVAYVDGFSP